jgi:hypothetical protein
MKVTFAHLCDYATISREGKLSVLGIFGAVNVPVLPKTHPMMYLVFEIEFSTAEFDRDLKFEVKVADADGGPIAAIQGKFRIGGKIVAGETPKVPQVLPLANLPIAKAGNYQFSIFLNDAHQMDVPFAVKLAHQPPVGPTG